MVWMWKTSAHDVKLLTAALPLQPGLAPDNINSWNQMWCCNLCQLAPLPRGPRPVTLMTHWQTRYLLMSLSLIVIHAPFSVLVLTSSACCQALQWSLLGNRLIVPGLCWCWLLYWYHQPNSITVQLVSIHSYLYPSSIFQFIHSYFQIKHSWCQKGMPTPQCEFMILNGRQYLNLKV